MGFCSLTDYDKGQDCQTLVEDEQLVAVPEKWNIFLLNVWSSRHYPDGFGLFGQCDLVLSICIFNNLTLETIWPPLKKRQQNQVKKRIRRYSLIRQ